jgi:hypothetical protein
MSQQNEVLSTALKLLNPEYKISKRSNCHTIDHNLWILYRRKIDGPYRWERLFYFSTALDNHQDQILPYLGEENVRLEPGPDFGS